MNKYGPALEVLLRRLSECPHEFHELPRVERGSEVLLAIVCDYFRDLGKPRSKASRNKLSRTFAQASPNTRALFGVAVWLLADDWFIQRADLSQAYQDVLTGRKLARLADLIRADLVTSDPDRREELARVVLDQLGLRPAGETAAQSADRLNTLDSVERQRVLKATAAAEKRAREVREAMARKRAMESASRYGE